ncbi:MAG: winged helix-turn-helix transcriptional regulator [Nanoarchaeota archaeon]|nr:winged helix-turn-helix transcriptional regulator [Nanoarchaeota archaeon]
MAIKAWLGAFILVLLLVPVCALGKEYYANVEIEVFENGDVQIQGISNHPELEGKTTQDYTSKDKSVWLLNISPEGMFSDYFVEITFPKDAVINYMKIPNILSMEEESGSVVIKSTGKDERFRIITQYSIDHKSTFLNVMIILAGIFIIIMITAGSYILIKKNKAKKTMPKYNPEALTKRQKIILDLVIKNKGHITQSQLQKSVKIPKASMSRNIETLVRKGIVVKEQKGMTNVISLNSMKKAD